MVKGKEKQKVFDLPLHIRVWNIEYLSTTSGRTPDPTSFGVLNLDNFPTGTNGILDLQGVYNIVLTVYDKNMKKCGKITLNDY